MVKKTSKSKTKTVTAADRTGVSYQQSLANLPLVQQVAVLATMAQSLAKSLAGIQAAIAKEAE